MIAATIHEWAATGRVIVNAPIFLRSDMNCTSGMTANGS